VDASDIGQQPGQFVWADGTKVDEAFWYNSNPNDFGTGKETCVFLLAPDGHLVDISCTFAGISFICEVAEKDLTC